MLKDYYQISVSLLSCLEGHRILTHMQEDFFSLGCLHSSPAVKQVTSTLRL